MGIGRSELIVVLDLRKHYFTKEHKCPGKNGRTEIFFKAKKQQGIKTGPLFKDRTFATGSSCKRGRRQGGPGFQTEEGKWGVMGLMLRKCITIVCWLDKRKL